MDFGSDHERMRQHKGRIYHYQAASMHLREYAQSLPATSQTELAVFRFPDVPPRFTERFVPVVGFRREIQERRKAKTDVLVPLATTLVALILERKKAAQRFVEWFRSQVAAVDAGELSPCWAVLHPDGSVAEPRFRKHHASEAAFLIEIRRRRTIKAAWEG